MPHDELIYDDITFEFWRPLEEPTPNENNRPGFFSVWAVSVYRDSAVSVPSQLGRHVSSS
jgi:hypothetical protein